MATRNQAGAERGKEGESRDTGGREISKNRQVKDGGEETRDRRREGKSVSGIKY